MMPEVRQTEAFARWLDGLRDLRARAKIQVRIERLRTGNPGDVKSVSKGISELRISYGPGYRVYFTRRGLTIIILLAGGTKKSQPADIRKAEELARNLEVLGDEQDG